VIQTSAGPEQQTDSSDPRLIERFRLGEPAALDEVIERYQLDVTRTVRRLLGWRGDVEDVVQEESPADESIQRDEVAEQVRIAVRKLGTKEREVVVLYYLEELSVAEVAKILKVSEGAIDVRLHRARKKLKEMLSWMK
jgi:DNA-directed RNA polymerase specialized sigma24 family protein